MFVQLAEGWAVTPNVRHVYDTLNATLAWWFYQNHVLIKAKMTLVCTSDGTTGPTTLADATDRLTDATKTATQGATAAAVQSWALYENADGLQTLIAYTGATADIAFIAYSPLGLYALAATTTHRPTASDEVIVSTATTIIGTGTSLDRVMSIWLRTDGRGWRCAVWRSNALLGMWTVERIASMCPAGVFDVPYVGTSFLSLQRTSTAGQPTGGISATAAGAASWRGVVARVATPATRIIRAGGGDISRVGTAGNVTGVSGVNIADSPALQGGAGMPLIPLYWNGEQVANMDGFLGTPIDWWAGHASTTALPAAADSFTAWDDVDDPLVDVARVNWLVALGPCAVWPWRNAAAVMEIT